MTKTPIFAIIFDLDGTLADTLFDIALAMNAALEDCNYPTHHVADYKKFVGRGLANLVSQTMPFEQAQDADNHRFCFEKLMQHYSQNCLVNTKTYAGIDEMLAKLDELEIPKSILSNKADHLTQIICGELFKKNDFHAILGSTEKFPRKPNPEAALFLASQMNVEPKNVLYVGDSDIDMKTANAANFIPLGVTWGFRSREELQKSGAKFIVDHPLEILEIL